MNFPVLKDKLIRSASGLLSGLAKGLNTLAGMLLGSEAFSFFSMLIFDSISSVVGCMKKKFQGLFVVICKDFDHGISFSIF